MVSSGAASQESTLQADVVVIGAGIVGASCAYHLAESGLRVRVLEALGAPAEGSSGRSFASVRAQWADPLNIELSWRSIQAYRDFERAHGIDIGYRPSGYLFLVPESRWTAHCAAFDLQREFDVPVSKLSMPEAQKRTPFAERGIAGATWGEADGVVDPQGVASAYLRLARERGATVHFREPARAISRDAGGWNVRSERLEIETTRVVNAAGGWGREVAALAGLDVPVDHVRRVVFSSAPMPDHKRLPMTIDVESGVYLRSEGDRVLFGLSRSDEPPGYSDTVDWEWLETVMDVGSSRFPWLADIPLDRAAAWAGTYEMTADDLPIVGENVAAPGWIDVCGFSGHGIIQAPEAGRLVAEEAVEGTVTSIDINSLRIARFDGVDGAARTELVF